MSISATKRETEAVKLKQSRYFTKAPDINEMPSYKVVSNINIKQMEPFITTKQYTIAHAEANFWEQKMFPKSFKSMAKFDELLKNNELAGANDSKGQLYVSAKVTVKHRQEVAYHEWVESLVRKMLNKT